MSSKLAKLWDLLLNFLKFDYSSTLTHKNAFNEFIITNVIPYNVSLKDYIYTKGYMYLIIKCVLVKRIHVAVYGKPLMVFKVYS